MPQVSEKTCEGLGFAWLQKAPSRRCVSSNTKPESIPVPTAGNEILARSDIRSSRRKLKGIRTFAKPIDYHDPIGVNSVAHKMYLMVRLVTRVDFARSYTVDNARSVWRVLHLPWCMYCRAPALRLRSTRRRCLLYLARGKGCQFGILPSTLRSGLFVKYASGLRWEGYFLSLTLSLSM